MVVVFVFGGSTFDSLSLCLAAMNKEEKFALFRAQAKQHLDQIEAQRIKTALSAFLADRVRPFYPRNRPPLFFGPATRHGSLWTLSDPSAAEVDPSRRRAVAPRCFPG